MSSLNGSFKSMLVNIMVLAINESDDTCTIQLSFNGGESRTIKGVMLNRLLKHHLLNDENDNVQIGKLYSCGNNNEYYSSNPMCLVKFKQSGEVRYLLKPVYYDTSKKESVELPTGEKLLSYENYHYKKKDYYRYVDTTISSFIPKRKSFMSNQNNVDEVEISEQEVVAA